MSVPNKNTSKTLLIGLGLMTIIVAVGGVYFWQHKKLVQANNEAVSVKSQNSKLDAKVTSLDNKVASLQNQYNQAKATIDNYQAAAKAASTVVIATQADLTLAVNGAQYVNPDGTVTAGGKWFGVNITLTNNTASTVSVNESDFHLKDLQDNEYTEETIQGASTLPAGWVSLPNQTLAPGETLRGTVTFLMTSNTVKSFNFINVTKTYPVNSSN